MLQQKQSSSIQNLSITLPLSKQKGSLEDYPQSPTSNVESGENQKAANAVESQKRAPNLKNYKSRGVSITSSVDIIKALQMGPSIAIKRKYKDNNICENHSHEAISKMSHAV
ncbi:hypothetical protein ACH5RR_007039 [Cinchona calisaya]|uniref:Uncharacterized protein n=1 Tax=Cinchona calisaya TaxID=153742 RepID=A0ABD3AQS2_9GENT